MSTFYPYMLNSPACAESTEVHLAKGLHITRLPDTDFDRAEYIAVEPEATTDVAAARKLAIEVFDAAFTFGPPIAEELAENMRCRLVFGMRSLREKLLLWQAGLDDRVVEALKGDWLKGSGKGLRAEVLRVVAVHAGGHILVARLAPTASLLDGILAVQPASLVLGFTTFLNIQYEHRLSRARHLGADYPFLHDPWLVDLYANAPD